MHSYRLSFTEHGEETVVMEGDKQIVTESLNITGGGQVIRQIPLRYGANDAYKTFLQIKEELSSLATQTR